MKTDRNSRESKALNIMRFPLAALIVLLHTDVACGPENLAYYFVHYGVTFIVTVAVPAFFFISGYLFFMGKENYSLVAYVNAMRKKAKGLLLLYMLWNIIAYVLSWLYLCQDPYDGGMPWEIGKIFWANGDGITTQSLLGYTYPVIVSPAAGVLWFMRDLMMMMVLSVVMYPMVKRLKWAFVLLLVAINVLKLGVPFPGFSLSAITWFYLGAMFSIHDVNVFSLLRRYCRSVWLMCPVLIMVQIIIKAFNINAPYVSLVANLAGIAFVFNWAYTACLRKDKWHTCIYKWGETSFFIYTFANTLIVWFLNKDLVGLLITIPAVGPLVGYFTSFGLRICECIVVFYVMKRHAPQLLGVLVGGRIKS